ncbi:MAG: tripartite tricarboxylate transporter substrate binding protein [Xanthobacteraceae bacterium]|jgi:tripartite-type tricarboxylate transporter receptor subunit TctC
MKFKLRGFTLLNLMGALSFAAAGAGASAQGPYPARHVTIIVGLTAGTPADTVARVVADKMSARSGQSFIVENRPGAGTSIAAADVVKAPPDGYMLYVSTNANTTNPNFNDLTFNFSNDLAPVTTLADAPLILAVNPAMPATLANFVAEAKNKAGQFTYGSSGIGTATHLFAELFAYEEGVKLTHVPYKGSTQTVTDLLAGRIQIMFSPAGTVIPQIKTAKLRGLAVSGHQHLPDLPDIPTFEECGVKGLDTGFWFGLNAPAGTPAPVIAYLNQEVGEVLGLPDVRALLVKQTLYPVSSTSADFGKFIRQDTEKWGRLIKDAGIKTSN